MKTRELEKYNERAGGVWRVLGRAREYFHSRTQVVRASPGTLAGPHTYAPARRIIRKFSAACAPRRALVIRVTEEIFQFVA